MTDLTNLNTLKVPAIAKSLLEINTLSDIKKINTSEAFMFLGHGANVLFTKDFPGAIVKNNLSGIKIISENTDSVTIEVSSGENWHNLVEWSVKNNWSGIENLALIPGTFGAAIVGNIAAYSQQTSDVIESVNIINVATQKSQTLSKTDCGFAYRTSIFQTELKDNLIISAIIKLFKVSQIKTEFHDRNLSLSDEIKKLFPSKDPSQYSSANIFAGVISIRTKKMPDWNKIGTAGSFFKNPFITKEKLKELQSKISELQYYPVTAMDYPKADDPRIAQANILKIPVGRLLDELGWRNKRIGNVGTYDRHALVVVNYGGATGQEIYEFSEQMRADIKKNYTIDLEYEVKII